MCVDGDDAKVVLPLCLVTPEALARYRAGMSSLGIVPEASLCFPLAWEGGLAGEFCSSVVYLDDTQTPRTMLTLSRRLKKQFFNTKTDTKKVDQLGAATIRSRLMVSARAEHQPCVRRFLSLAMRTIPLLLSVMM